MDKFIKLAQIVQKENLEIMSALGVNRMFNQ